MGASRTITRNKENTPARVGGSDNQPPAESPLAAAPADNIGDVGQDLSQAESQAESQTAEPQTKSEGESIASGSTLAAATANRQSRFGREIRPRNVYDPSPENPRQRGNRGIGRRGFPVDKKAQLALYKKLRKGSRMARSGKLLFQNLTVRRSVTSAGVESGEAIDAELTALLTNGTWEYVDRPEGINIVDNK